MTLTQRLLAVSLGGADWVLWLLLLLSVLSVAILVERLLFVRAARLSDSLLALLRQTLHEGDTAAAAKLLAEGEGIERIVAREGLAHLPRGAGAAAEAMTGVRARERLRLERNLAILGTLGNNAPFIGLFGTVIGVIKAFRDLSQNQAGGFSVVMAGLSEALVATAAGLLVAIPAVMAFNFLSRQVRARLARADEVAHLILAMARREG